MDTQPIPSGSSSFTKKVTSNKRIALSPAKVLRRLKVLFVLSLAAIFFAGIMLLFSRALSMTAAIIFIGTVGILVTALFTIGKKAKSASIKGDTLILKGLDNKNCVTTLHSVRTVKTYEVIGFQITTLRYSLDGRSHLSILLGNPPGVSITVETCLRKAIQLSKKKANHKPGSVGTN